MSVMCHCATTRGKDEGKSSASAGLDEEGDAEVGNHERIQKSCTHVRAIEPTAFILRRAD